jgi:hypothetical protein
MQGICLVNQTTDPSITYDVVQKASSVLASYVAEVAAGWGRVPVPVACAETVEAARTKLGDGWWLARALDQLDDQSALAYHTVLADGTPSIDVGWGIIKANGGDLFGRGGFLSTSAHEYAEAFVDPYVDFWADAPDGSYELSLEVCDPVQGDEYEIDRGSGIYVANFVGPRYFSSLVSPGKIDRMGLCTRTFEIRKGGYGIKRFGGPGGHVQDVFGAAVHEGGMPQWRRDAKRVVNVDARYWTRRSRRYFNAHGLAKHYGIVEE